MVGSPVGTRTATVFTQTQPVSGLTRTKLTAGWDAIKGRWAVKQFYPLAEDWDNVQKIYTSSNSASNPVYKIP